MTIRVGIGGWTYEPWRQTFYPKGLPQKRELEYAASKLTAIEINSTYYGSQKPESFARWHDETPDGFVFAVKGPRFATNRRALAEAADSIDKFFESGVLKLKDKLGPVNWQFMATKKFDAGDFGAFLELLPKKLDGRTIRHAVEVRHDSFLNKDFISLCRAHEVAIVAAGDSEFPLIADVTAPFVYVRLMGTQAKEPAGYSKSAIKGWLARAKSWAAGGAPQDLKLLDKMPAAKKRDVFLFVISGAKERNPATAVALLKELG